MNEAQNPFEAMLNAGGNVDLFEGSSSPAIDLGSEAIAANPFEMPEPPAVNTGSETGATNSVAAPTVEAAAIPATANSIPTSMPVQPLPNQPQQLNSESGQAQPPLVEAAPQAPVIPDSVPASLFPEQATNPVEAAEETRAIAQLPVFARLPIFEHGAVKEDIEDLTQTFEDLRVAKMEDFPELEDGNRVSWEITYGKVRKTVYGAEAKKKKIGEFKASIEMSKEFTEGLKKSKEKSPACIVKPRVTAQSKGEKMPSYKGIFTNLEDARASGKAICIVPGSDGKVYEIRNEEAGIFIMPVSRCKELPEITAGFIPALPLVPRSLLVQIITFFRSLLFTDAGGSYEGIANIMWDRQCQVFCACVPKQIVSAVRADSDLTLSEDLDSGRFLHYMDVHSHNLMPAIFSRRDDRDEKATRLYALLGRLDCYLPEISVRMGCGGRHLPIDPGAVFEPFWEDYPDAWNGQVTFSGTVPDHQEGWDELEGISGLSLLPLPKGSYGEAA